MKSKSEVRPLIVSFHKMIYTQFGVGFKAIHYDNAFEFCMLTSLVLMVLFIKRVMLILHNRILLWKESINIF